MTVNVAVTMPLGKDYHADVRSVRMLESWAKANDVVTVYESAACVEECRDKIITTVNYIQPKPSHVLFVDSDVLPKPRTLEVLLSHDKDIITGVVPICQKGVFKWNVSRDIEPIGIDDLPQNLFKVKWCGFGVVLIKTEVFDKLKWPYWQSVYQPGRKLWTEDVYFCHKAIEAGFDIWCDPKVKCNHVTRSNYLSIIRNMKGTKS